MELSSRIGGEIGPKKLMQSSIVEQSSELTEEDEEQSLLEWPVVDESTPGTVRKGSSYLGPWYPEDATVEVFTENPTFKSDLIEMSLEESEIRTRVEVQEGGFKKVFVSPEDESAAREIIREIVEETPLE